MVHTYLSALSVVDALSFLVWRAAAFCLQTLFAGRPGVPHSSTGKVCTCSCNMYASIIHNTASPSFTAGMSHRPINLQCQTLQVDWTCRLTGIAIHHVSQLDNHSQSSTMYQSCVELWCHAVSTILLPASMPPRLDSFVNGCTLGSYFFSHAYISSLRTPGQQ